MVYESSDCLIYDRSDKPQIYLCDFNDGGATHPTKLPWHVIGFMLEGRIRLTYPDQTSYLFVKGEMVFIPSGSIYTWCITEPVLLLVYQLQDPGFRLCEKFAVESLYIEDAGLLWQEHVRNPDTKTGKAKLKNRERFAMLPIHPRLQRHLESVSEIVGDGFRCKKFFEMEIETFFILLRCYYEKKELYAFMRFIMTGNMVFTEYVRLRWTQYYTVSELASSMNMSLKHFSRQFIQYFGQRPSTWMSRNRARLIFDELTTSNKPLKQIASDNGFYSISQFSTFVKRVLGKSATEIRNGDGTYPDN